MFTNVCVLIPVYNESKKISGVVAQLKNHFNNIIVVNDGSTDSTLEVIKHLDVIVINHALNLGQGAAISSGLKFIKDLLTNSTDSLNFNFLGLFGEQPKWNYDFNGYSFVYKYVCLK